MGRRRPPAQERPDLEMVVQRIVATFPPLTAEQRNTIAALLHPARAMRRGRP